MKMLAVAAIALAGLTLPTAPAQADGSNCTILNGPFCETAHNIRHHGWQLPIVWEQPHPYPHWPQPCYRPQLSHCGGIGYPGGHHWPQQWPQTSCAIPSPWSCRHRVPVYGGYGY